jgi:lipopolysaccharide/colanic/teichoic acid biosynthesis glycosyltransferase
LLLLDTGDLLGSGAAKVLSQLQSALSESTRDTDLTGWYKEQQIIGVIFTEIGDADSRSIVCALSKKLVDALYRNLGIQEINQLKLSFHLFPEDWDDADRASNDPVTSVVQMALANHNVTKKASLALKRLLDIAGSLAALIVCIPFIMVICIAIKMTSRGPVVFKQLRLGQYGKHFTFLKFRSMYIDSSPNLHEEYVRHFIQGAAAGLDGRGNGGKVYKLVADPRITPFGRFLRSTSLDELPQFLNVLRGDMSLVGPRPPVPYEYRHYDLWHRRRILAVRPGITGLWQVVGRSRVTFDDMVRMDIQYARTWSLWLDIKILLLTPRAVLSGAGAH